MSPFLGFARSCSFSLLHSLFCIFTKDQPHRHLVAVRQLHDYVRDFPRITFRTPFESSQHLVYRTDRGLVVRQQVLTPNGATSIASESLKPPTAHFAA